MKRLVASLAIACLTACWTLWPREVLSHETTTNTVVFDREIVRILDTHCVMCHAENALSFALSTYEQTWLRRRPVLSAILRRHMPPWAAVPGYGQFANDNSLTLREMQFIVSWVEGLGPRNAGTVFLNIPDAQRAPPPQARAQPHAAHWQLGEPDLLRRLATNRMAANQPDFVTRTVIDLGLTAERRVRALEYMPGDRRVVRAAFFTLQATGQWIGSWTPWYGITTLPAGVAYRVPAGARVVAEIHYRGAEQDVDDAGTLGLFFAEQATTRAPSDLVLETKTAGVSPGGAARLRATTRLASDTYVWALKPDIPPGVTSIEVSARRPDGGTDILLFAKDFSAAWPTPYILKEPLLVRRGSELSITAYAGDRRPSASSIRMTVSRY